MLNLAATLPDMTENDAEGRNGAERDDPPDRLVTANQIVAWNLARYRRAAGLTQEELGALIGWTNTAVSEAERSWNGIRTREFDAQVMTRIALALRIPVIALLIPPSGDGQAERYIIPDGDCGLDMGMYLARAVTPDSEDDGPAADDYRKRYAEAAYRYLDPYWAGIAARWVKGSQSPAELADLKARLRDRQHNLEAAAAEFGQLADGIPDQDGDR